MGRDKRTKVERHNYYISNKEQINNVNRQWYLNNKERVKENSNRVRKELRDAIFLKLGNKCTVCGIDDRRCLQIDHVKGNGSKDRLAVGHGRGSTRKYLRDILADETGSFQILCANHNWIKRFDNGEIKETE